jgi:hypothetical protein
MGNHVPPIMHTISNKEPKYPSLKAGALEGNFKCNIRKPQVLQFTMLQYIETISVLKFSTQTLHPTR